MGVGEVGSLREWLKENSPESYNIGMDELLLLDIFITNTNLDIHLCLSLHKLCHHLWLSLV